MTPAVIVAEALFVEAVRNAGLTPRQADVLRAIGRADAMSQISLTAQVSMDRTTLSKVCRRLVRKGLIRRRRVPNDTRLLALTVTAHGFVVLADIQRAATRARRAADDVVCAIDRLCMGPFAGSAPSGDTGTH